MSAPHRLQKLPRAFYAQPTLAVAEMLLGACLVRCDGDVMRIGRIVEVEAYLGVEDLAAHSSKGITPRTRTMFGPPGHAYVYLIYGMHHCMNVVTEPEGTGTAVLIRALEPVSGIDHNTRGPGLLCKAMGIDRSLNAHDLCSEDFFIAPREGGAGVSIVRRPRIGVDYAGEDWASRPLRFYIEGNPFVSRK